MSLLFTLSIILLHIAPVCMVAGFTAACLIEDRTMPRRRYATYAVTTLILYVSLCMYVYGPSVLHT